MRNQAGYNIYTDWTHRKKNKQTTFVKLQIIVNYTFLYDEDDLAYLLRPHVNPQENKKGILLPFSPSMKWVESKIRVDPVNHNEI